MTFGDGPAVRVLDHLLDNKYLEFSLSDVLRGADISYNTVRGTWTKFVASGVIVPAGKNGKALLYRLNMKNVFVQQLIALDHEMTKTFVE